MTSDTQISEAKITQAELVDMFGAEMPVDAFNLLANCPADWTPDRMRAELRKFATSPKVGSGELDAAGLVGLVDEIKGLVVASYNDKRIAKSNLNTAAHKLAFLRSALASPVDHPEVVGVKIKPLVWEDPGLMILYAASLVGRYKINPDGYWWRDAGEMKAAGSVEAAKAAAQQDFETRVRSALQPSDSPAIAGIANDAAADGWRPIVQRPTDRSESWFRLADGSTFWGRWNRDHWERRTDALTMTAATEARGGVEREGVDYPLNIFERLPDGVYPVAWRSDSPALEAGVAEEAQYAVDRRTLEEAALDTSISDGAVRALCVARVGKITDEVRQWAAALSIPAKESGK